MKRKNTPTRQRAHRPLLVYSCQHRVRTVIAVKRRAIGRADFVAVLEEGNNNQHCQQSRYY